MACYSSNKYILNIHHFKTNVIEIAIGWQEVERFLKEQPGAIKLEEFPFYQPQLFTDYGECKRLLRVALPGLRKL